MKKEFLLLLGSLLFLTGCGPFRKKAPRNKTTIHENQKAEVFTESDTFEEDDGTVRSFFATDDNEYYTQHEFEHSVKSFVAEGVLA